jgi:hypothetical protein
MIKSRQFRYWNQPVKSPVKSMGISGSYNGGTVPYKTIFWEDIPLHRPYIGLIYGRYLQFRFLKWPLMKSPSEISHLWILTMDSLVLPGLHPGLCQVHLGRAEHSVLHSYRWLGHAGDQRHLGGRGLKPGEAWGSLGNPGWLGKGG